MNKNVFKMTNGVKINFTGVVAKEQIVKMVENCATGACECMSDTTKKKISNMQVEGKDGDVSLNLSGDISKEEIEKALAKSKVLNKSSIKIELLGTQCSKCKALEKVVKEALSSIDESYQYSKIDDLSKIMEYGVVSTPALVINGEVKSVGKLLTLNEVIALLKNQ